MDDHLNWRDEISGLVPEGEPKSNRSHPYGIPAVLSLIYLGTQQISSSLGSSKVTSLIARHASASTYVKKNCFFFWETFQMIRGDHRNKIRLRKVLDYNMIS